MDVKNLIHENFEYSRLDRTILMRDGFVEIDMVLSGLSFVSDVGFKQKNTWGSEIGAEHLEMPWK